MSVSDTNYLLIGIKLVATNGGDCHIQNMKFDRVSFFQ